MVQTQTRQDDPIARLALFVLLAVIPIAFLAPGVQAGAPQQIIATPAPVIVFREVTAIPQPTQAPPEPTPMPAIEVAPTQAPPVIVVVEQPAPPPEPVVVEQAPAPVEQPAPTAVPEPQQQLASGVVVVQTKEQFIDSFAAPDDAAKCAFVSCLGAP